MGKKPRRTFSKEFKTEALRLHEEQPVAEVARSLGVQENSFYRWKVELAESGPGVFRGRGNRTALL